MHLINDYEKKKIYKQNTCSNCEKFQHDVATERKGICHKWVNDRTETERRPCFKGCQLLYAHDLFGFMCNLTVKSVKPH